MGKSGRRPAQGDPAMAATLPKASPAKWRIQLQPEERQRGMNKLLKVFKKHLPTEDSNELQKIVVQIEEKIYAAAVNHSDYLRRISQKMVSIESTVQQYAPINPSMLDGAAGNQNTADTASLDKQLQINNQSQALSMPIIDQTSTLQRILPQNIQNNILETSDSKLCSLASFERRNQSTVSGDGQNGPDESQSALSSSVAQTTTSDICANARRQIQGRQQQQSQSQLLYPHQLQTKQQLKQQKLQQSSGLRPHIPQQKQQSLLQTTQLHPSQQPLMQMPTSLQSAQYSIPPTQSGALQSAGQPGALQSDGQPGLQHSHLSSVPHYMSYLLPQHSQLVARTQQQQQPTFHQQTSTLQQQPASVTQQFSLLSQQNQPQPIVSQASMSIIQPTQFLGQQTSVAEIQQQPQRISVQQNSLSSQQTQQRLNQRNIPLHQQKHLGDQNNSMLQQQEPFLGFLHDISNMQHEQPPLYMLQPPKLMVQQQHQHEHQQPRQEHQNLQVNGTLQSHNPQSQHQPSEQLMSQIQSQPAHLQQHLTTEQEPNNLQREIHQRSQLSGVLFPHNAIEQQKQFDQSQRKLPAVYSSIDSASGHLASVDWQEEIYKKIKSMKELYYTSLNELCQSVVMKLQQHETLVPAVGQSERYEKFKSLKMLLERRLGMLQLPKGSIQPIMKDRLPVYEKQIIHILAANTKVTTSLLAGQQLQQSGGHIQSSAQQPPDQLPQLQLHENRANQIQQMNFQDSVASMQAVPLESNQHGYMSLSAQFSPSSAQQTLTNTLQFDTTIDQAQENSFVSLQQGSIVSIQQSILSEQNNVATLSHNPMKNSIQSSSSALQLQNKKHKQEQQLQHMMQTQEIKQQLQQQLIQQKQQLLQTQKLMQQQKQQSSIQMPIHQTSQLHQSSDINKMKAGQASNIKPGLKQQYYAASQHQRFKSGAVSPNFSPPNLQPSSLQISHDATQVDQQSLLPSQSTNSPIVLSPTSLVTSPICGETEKPISGISSLSNVGHIGVEQPSVASVRAQLSVATPGMSSSNLLQEFTNADGNQFNLPTEAASKTVATEDPLARIIRMVKSSNATVLSSAINDIGSVVSIFHGMSGPVDVNGSRCAAGEDLVAMAKHRLQARNFMTQDGSAAKKMKCDTNVMPLNNVSSDGSVSDNFKQSYGLHISKQESTATSCVKQWKTKVRYDLLEEIEEINQRLIATVVTVSAEEEDSTAAASTGDEGTVIKCSFTPAAVSPQFASAQIGPILPLRLLVSANYPKCSPVLLDQLSDNLSTESYDLSVKAKSRFSRSLRDLSQPISLREMARTWEACAHQVIAEYAKQIGGGCFSSRYGTWESCVGA